MWDNIQGGFLDHLTQIDEDLKAAGLPALGLDALQKPKGVEIQPEVAEFTEATTVNDADLVVVNGKE